MPTPTLRPDASGQFYAHWSANRRSHRKSMRTTDRTVAEQRFATWLLTRNDATPDADLTVAECWSIYAAGHLNKIVTADTISAIWTRHLAPHFGAIGVSDLTQRHVDRYVALRTSGRLGRAAQPQTCRKELAVLIAVLNYVSSPRVKRLPASSVPKLVLPADAEPRDRWLNTDELQRLFAAARTLRPDARLSRGERFMWIALETAARLTAILELTWDRVDLAAGVIHFDVPGRRRTTKRRAAVSISSSLRPVLERAYRERVGDRVLDHGGPVWRELQSIAGAAGVEGVSPHVFRHSAATAMARNGVPLWKVAKTLGNSLAVTEKSYAKWAPDDPAGTVDRISNGVLEMVE